VFVQKSSEGSFLQVRELLEALCGLGGVLGLCWWMPASWWPSHLVFCVFFLLVFAIAVRYHTFVAYGTGSLAAAAYGLLLWVHPAARSAALSVTLEPFLLLLTAICASDILRWQRLRLTALERKYAHTHKALQEARVRCQQLALAGEALERQVSGLPASLVTISERLAQLWMLEGSQRFSALVDLLISVLDARSCACYLQERNELHLCAERMIEGSAHAPVLDLANPLVKRVVARRQVSTIYDALAEEKAAPSEGPVMAGPLLDSAGELMGVVVVDGLPLLKLTPGVTRLFGSLLHIVSLSLQVAAAKTRREGPAMDGLVIDPEQTEPALLAQTRTGISFSQ
jgi:hypothetical protein